jgi:hypothetical protein
MEHKNHAFNRRRMLQLASVSMVGSSLSPILFSKEIAIPDQMQHHLKQANKVARTAMKDGHHPFGAVLVAADNETVVMQQGNLDSVAHAESTLAQRGAKQFNPDKLWGMTLYTPAEPCVMCASRPILGGWRLECQNANIEPKYTSEISHF